MKPGSYARFRFKTFWSHLALRFSVFTALFFLIEVIDSVWKGFGTRWIVFGAAGIALSYGVVSGYVAQKRLRNYSIPLANGGEVVVVVDDFMANLNRFTEASCVFGVNDRFSVEDLKADSVHACFLAEYGHADRVEDQTVIDRELIDSGLMAKGVEREGSGPNERRSFEYGEVVRIPFGQNGGQDERGAFLMVNSSRHRLGYEGRGSTSQIIRNVWEFHEQQSICSEQLIFPLLGTGHSRDLNKMQSLFHIIDEYFNHLDNGTKPVRVKKLVVSLLPRALINGDVRLEDIHRYIRARAAVQGLSEVAR